jgi:uroporphyrinogen decarboxylase
VKNETSRRSFLCAALAAAAAAREGRVMFGARNKRDTVMGLLDPAARQDYVPAAFFLHFDDAFHFGQPAVRKHLEYFRHTDMDLLKIQYERTFPPIAAIRRPEDWKAMPSYTLDFYEPVLEAVRGLVKEAGKEALVLVTLYSPFMCAGHSTSLELLTAHLQENPVPVRHALEVITDSLMLFVKECVRIGVDGFYASTQGGEAGRFADPQVFSKYIKPFDLVLMNEMKRSCRFNILHVCDYNGPYADFAPYLDYPGHLVNCNPRLTTKTLTWPEVARMFKRPCMGGLDRHGIIATGSQDQIAAEVSSVLSRSSVPFFLGADCTLPADTKWDNIRAAVAAAHAFRRG